MVRMHRSNDIYGNSPHIERERGFPRSVFSIFKVELMYKLSRCSILEPFYTRYTPTDKCVIICRFADLLFEKVARTFLAYSLLTTLPRRVNT